MKRKIYEKPALIPVLLETADVIATSGGFAGEEIPLVGGVPVEDEIA